MHMSPRINRCIPSLLGCLILLPLAAPSACGGDQNATELGLEPTDTGAAGTDTRYSRTDNWSGKTDNGSGSSGRLCLDVKPLRIVPPAGLNVRFRLLDCDGNAVRPLTESDVAVWNNEKNAPFGQGGEGDSVSGVGENSNIELYSVVVLDLSNSIFEAGAIDAVIDGAKAFVEATVTKPEAALKHRVALIAFGRPDRIILELAFTQDDKALVAKLEALRVSPPRGTTDLYGAYMLALKTVAAAGSGGDAPWSSGSWSC